MRTVIMLIITAYSGWLNAQDTLSLFGCYDLAIQNAPRLNDREVLQNSGELKSAMAGSSWYPSLDLNGRLSYQSDVVTITLADPGIPVNFPEVPKDQYGLNLDLKQTLFDGGMTRQQKELEQARTDAALQQLEVDLHGLKNRVNQYYFAILILQEQRKNLEIHRENLEQRREMLEAAVEEGTVLEEELKVIDVELLKMSQSVSEVDTRREAFLEVLGLLCGGEFDDGTVLQAPQFGEVTGVGSAERNSVGIDEEHIAGTGKESGAGTGVEGNRPEYRLFELQDASMEASKELLGKKRMPVLYAFGQTGYGKPGYNMLSGEWDFYYKVGAGLSWKILDWNSNNRERQVIANQQRILENQRTAFTRELESQLAQERSRMAQYRQSIRYEKEVLALQQQISGNAEARLESGTITMTEYITELNKENLARISLETHRIQLLQAMANYYTIQGTF